MNDEVRKVIVIGVALGLTAALVVWWLERFEEQRMYDRLHVELGRHLGNYSRFQEWLREHGEA